MDVNQIKSQYEGYRGWNDPAAILADFRATGGAGKGGSSTQVSQSPQSPQAVAPTQAPITTQSTIDIARQMRQFNVESAQPAIQTLQAGQAPLKQRYDELLKSIKARGTQEVGQADIISARELGRRGIPTDSTFAGEFQQEKRLPVQTAFGGLEAETGLQGEQAQQAIASAIAQLQAGGGQNAISQALQLYQQQQQGIQSKEQLAQQLAQAQKEQAFKEQVFREVTLPESIYSRGKPYYEPKTNSGNEKPASSYYGNGNINGQTQVNYSNQQNSPKFSTTPGRIYQQPDGSTWLSTANGWQQV